jgi:hypothetical protein
MTPLFRQVTPLFQRMTPLFQRMTPLFRPVTPLFLPVTRLSHSQKPSTCPTPCQPGMLTLPTRMHPPPAALKAVGRHEWESAALETCAVGSP